MKQAQVTKAARISESITELGKTFHSLLTHTHSIENMAIQCVKGATRITRILVLNPNSSSQMTLGLQKAIKGMEISPVCLSRSEQAERDARQLT
jgi:3-dehydroquinate dehydratase